jgi:hypothetical protein
VAAITYEEAIAPVKDDPFWPMIEPIAKVLWEAATKNAEALKPSRNKRVMALVQDWTRQAQCSSNTDDERAVYERCAHALHQLNAAK